VSDSEVIPFASIVTGSTFVLTFDMNCVSIVRPLRLRFKPSRLPDYISLP
jgi:hypothetical protein